MRVLCFRSLVFIQLLLLVLSQDNPPGFISIDCGLPSNSTSVDEQTNLTHVSDDQFIDTGVNYEIAPNYATDELYTKYLTVRSFPSGTRNCYTLTSLSAGSKYLVRAGFLYGNYDNKNNPPNFDIHLGVNYWGSVDLPDADGAYFHEIIATATSNYLQICLVKKDRGTPFISVLELRPLLTTLYNDDANATQSLVLSARFDIGARSQELRYPHDPYDRIWRNYTMETWRYIETNSTVQPDKDFATPSTVMQTAATTSSTNQSLDISWSSDNESTVFLIILHFSEIQELPPTALRQFDIFGNGVLALNSITPIKLYSEWAKYTHTWHTEYTASLKATSNSTLPPILNAFELYVVRPTTGIPTYSGDVAAINKIKANYQVNKGWSGDPCVPTEFSWTGVTCTTESNNIPRITLLNLSSCGLTGVIVSSFGNLSTLNSLDLSYNDLSGDLPTFLDQLSALTYLDVTGNSNISTTLPPGLQQRKRDGNLMFRFGGASRYSRPSNNKTKILLAVIIPVAAVGLLLLLACLIKRSGFRRLANGEEIRNKNSTDLEDLELFIMVNCMTARKLQSSSSRQGTREFLAEVRHLSRIHHRNLVPLIGYCKDGLGCMALVYEYMSGGSLRTYLRGKDRNARVLSWEERLHILLEAAQGLLYLHRECAPPIIHRDVKTENILLNHMLEAKIADFGLSKAFRDNCTHMSITVAGTPGYLDPEYNSSCRLTEKSDVYSFGVVLLEVVTAKPPIIDGRNKIHLTLWVHQQLTKGSMDDIVDTRILDRYDVNSAWKVVQLAMSCCLETSAQRPVMSHLVSELKDCLELVLGTSSVMDSGRSSSSRRIAFEVAKNGESSLPDGPSVR
ncbi:Leucine-rich repeat protein kinase family protein [Rhynchospora pubera]|uniref:non-specific serine/threonine protein kinase n=1 Tax=Rhynchospora pubera TaxID=906938 RepID=A0AAV8F9K4_9POAL|nr:Leucine-rich repeat protein kinase family protein [Rhynchospora pubera]